MAAESIIERSFSGGEIAPALYARVDHVKYTTGLRTMRNNIAMKYGGATQRPGTMYVGTTLNGGNAVRLIPFIYNETGLGQSYVLEFGNFYIAFWQNGGLILNPGTPAAWNNGTAYVPGNYVTSSGIIYFCIVANTNFTPASNPTKWIANPGNALMVATLYAQADLSLLDFAQSADVLAITHVNYAPSELIRNSPTSWTLTPLTSSLFGPSIAAPAFVSLVGTAGSDFFGYAVTAVNALGEESAPLIFDDSSSALDFPSVAHPVTSTWGAVSGAVSYRVYYTLVPTPYSFGFLVQVTGTSFKDTGVSVPNFSSSPSFSIYAPAAYGDWPAHVGYIQQRRGFAQTPNNPVGCWLSHAGAYRNFYSSIPALDSDAFAFSIAGDEVNSIQHILELKFMLMFTAGAELYVQGNGNGIVTPSSINASTQSQYGASPLRPLKIGDVLLFNQALGSFIRDFVFDFVIDGYRGNDVTMFASHLFEGYQIVDWAYQKVPDSIIWAVRSDGVLLSCTYVREQQILAWARHDFTNGFVENVCAIPENGEYAVYACIRRVINGSTVRYIERVSSRIWSDPINATYLDCFGEFDGRNVSGNAASLHAPIAIVAGVNDTIQWQDSSNSFGTPFSATLSVTGTFSPPDLALRITVIMDSVSGGGGGYTVQAIAGKFIITNSTYTFGLIYGSRTLLPTIGFPTGSGTGTGVQSHSAPNYPTESFSQSDQAYTQLLYLEADTNLFSTYAVGDQVFLQDALFVSSQGQQGNQVRLTIQRNDYGGSPSFNQLLVTPNRTVPADLQMIPTTSWSHAVKTVSGLSYLKGQQVSVWADRFVVGSPLNITVTKGVPYVVASDGTLTLDRCYSVIYVGLPMIADLETLAIDTSMGDSIIDENKNISQVVVYLYNSRGFFGGTQNPDTDPDNIANGVVLDALYNLTENKAQANRQNYDMPPNLLTGAEFTNVDCNWSKEGRIFIRNVDPIPLSVLAVVPAGLTSAKVAWSQRV